MLYQYRCYPTKKQTKLFNEQLEEHRLLYNKCLEYKTEQYKNNKINITCFDLIKLFPKQFKKQANYSSLQQTIRRLDKTYKDFFRRKFGFPRFRGVNRFCTIEYAKHGDGCKLTNILYLQNIGKIKCNIHRPHGKIKTLSVTLRNGQMYVNCWVEDILPICLPKGVSVGVDFGIKSTVTLSDGTSIVSPPIRKKYDKQLARCQRNKKWAAYHKINQKIVNKRKDFNHKLSRKLINQYDIICLEKLEVKGIQCCKNSNKNLKKNSNKKLGDIAINQLINYISYKAANAGKKVVLVPPAYTTQTCSKCGKIKKKSLKQRQHKCSCGLDISRDQNAAIVIKTLGLQSLGLKP
jgi:putative transposase